MMPLSKETRGELEAMRRRLLEMLAPLQTPESDQPDPAGDTERLRRALWASARELDTLLGEPPLFADLDLTKNDPDVQEHLYGLVVQEYFTLHLLADEGDIYIPLYTPEECGLEVFFQHGRWFVTWLKLEEDMDRPEALSRELLHFGRDANGQLVFTQV